LNFRNWDVIQKSAVLRVDEYSQEAHSMNNFWYAVKLLFASVFFMTAPGLHAATATGNLSVSAVVTDFCELNPSAVSLDLGTYVPSTLSSVSASLQVRCTVGTSASIGLGYGLNASGTTRRLKHATDPTVFLTYELYQPNGTTIWQAPGETGALGFTGTGISQSFSVTGKIPAAQWAIKTGSYTDTVVITVTFP
jgi:spore coat protein U-like protein